MTSMTRVVPFELDSTAESTPARSPLWLVSDAELASGTADLRVDTVAWQATTRWKVTAKRAIDVVVAAVLLVVTVPVMLAAAAAIKLSDRGPVLFRQERVGRDGRRLMVYKLRTMVPEADHQLPCLLPQNGREGPLFKLENDPRVTRVGRFLRVTSIDELPQLVAVLRGTMSMVGPRPALPCEVAQFDPALLDRLRVLPGITGLWQVEARDDPSFDSYRRFDLFYLNNWSLVLDLKILLSTVVVVLRRAVRAIWPSSTVAAETTIVLD